MPILLLRVAAAWPLPGLGLLALPDGPTPHLASYPLHTALAVLVAGPDGSPLPATATVEEVTRADRTERGLLLDADMAGCELLPDTEIWLVV